MFCRKCGSKLPDDSAFCYKCGASVEEKVQVEDSKLWEYNTAVKNLDKAQTAEDFEKIKAVLEKLGDYKDSAEKLRLCRENKIPILYDRTVELLNSAKSPEDMQKAEKSLKLLNGYKNSDELLKQCENDLKLFKYNDAFRKMQTVKTSEECRITEEMFASLGDFEDSAELTAKCRKKYAELVCEEAKALLKKEASSEELNLSLTRLEKLDGSEEVQAIIKDIKDKLSEIVYNGAIDKMMHAQSDSSAQAYEEAKNIFKSLANVGRSRELAEICDHNIKAIQLNLIIDDMQSATDEAAIAKCKQRFLAIDDFEEAQKMAIECDKQAESISRFGELKKLLLPLECSNDISSLSETRRKALAMNGIGNSAQIADECQRKIDSIKYGEYFTPKVTTASIVRGDLMNLKSELLRVSFDALLGVASPNMFCRKCGAKIPPNSDSVFCPNCLAEL